jgi:rod shape-determining protein MreC
MRNILRFLAKYSTILFFVLMQGVSLYLLFNYNNFQQSALFSTANRLNGWLYTIQESVYGYFNLRENNESLQRQNIDLELRVANLESALRNFTDSTKIPLLRSKAAEEFSLIPARVIQNSVTHYRNYITLNVGKADGVKPEMGVANSDGIVGVISLVTQHYSVVIPVLNRDQRFSCKLKNMNATGSLAWDGFDRRFAYLEEIPPDISVNKGDTVVTSGFSAVFPEGIMVGTVEDYKVSEDANYLRLKVRLATRFDAISNVRVVRYKHREEFKKLQEEAVL